MLFLSCVLLTFTCRKSLKSVVLLERIRMALLVALHPHYNLELWKGDSDGHEPT